MWMRAESSEQPVQADRAWWDVGQYSTPQRRGLTRRSLYVPMRDGVRLAVDMYLPADLKPGERLPTVLEQTRYHRRSDLRWPFAWLRRGHPAWIQRLVGRGYALVVADVRGTGASFGWRPIEFSPDEVRDGADLVDWIVRQSWSDGGVGAVGISYLGGAAALLLSHAHPAVKAVVPQFIFHDVYSDSLAPGGVRNDTFLRQWNALNRALDLNQISSYTRRHMNFFAGVALRGVARVDGDRLGWLLRQAVREHRANADVYAVSADVTFRDDTNASGWTVDALSPHTRIDPLQAANVPIYSWTGWFDAGFVMGAFKRFNSLPTPGSRLIVGPWDHAAISNPNPYSPDGKAHFDSNGEILRFLDWHLKGRPNGIEVEKPVHYYTMGEEAWKEAGEWPPRGYAARSFYLAENGSLELAQPTGPGADHYRVDYTASSGPNSRWSSMVNFKTMKTIYPDRAEQDQRLLVYQTAPLERALEVTGHPVLTLYLRSSAPDANLIVYLEEVTKAGEVRYVTEGWFRALHRKVQLQPHPHGLPVPVHSFCRADALPLPSGEVAAVSFDLLPTSYLFRIGNRIRLAIAGADAANVLPLSLEPPEFEVQRGAPYASHLRLPVKEWASGSIRRITG